MSKWKKKIKKFPIIYKQLKYIQSSSIWSTTWIEKWTSIDHKKKKKIINTNTFGFFQLRSNTFMFSIPVPTQIRCELSYIVLYSIIF